jgi:fucose permease
MKTANGLRPVTVRIDNKLKILVTFTCLSFLASSGLPTFVLEAVKSYHVSHSAAGSLESYTTLTQVLASFVMFSVLLKLGFRRATVIAWSFLSAAGLFLPFFNDVWSIRLYLVASGLSFVAIKIVCYSSVALVVKDEKEHASFINLMEAFFTTGAIAGMWIYSVFIGSFPDHWIRVLWVFVPPCVLLALIWAITPFDEHELRREEEKPVVNQFADIRYILTTTTLLFALLVFAYESLEQGVGSWLPTFNSEILNLPDALCIQMASLFTVGLVVGRFLGSFVLRRVKWYRLFLVNFVLSLVLLALFIPSIRQGVGAHATSIFTAPWVAFGIPVLGVLIGPVYPTLMSCVLESFPKHLHPIVMSTAMLVTPLSDSISSKLLGVMFGSLGGIEAFTLATVIPIGILLVLVYPFQLNRVSGRQRSLFRESTP